MESDPTTDVALAGAAIAMALFHKLIETGVLDWDVGLALLEDAKHIANKSSNTAASVVGAIHSKMSPGG